MPMPCRACGCETTDSSPLCNACAVVENAPMLGLDTDPGLAPTLAVPGRQLPGDLTAAFDTASPHAVLRLAPGDYTLRGPLTRRHPLTVIGAGPDQTRIHCTGVSAQALWHVHLAAGETVALSGLAIALAPASTPSELITVTAGQLRLHQCRLEGTGKASHGLSVRGDARLEAEGSAFLNLGGTGVRLLDAAQARLMSCSATGNGGYGLLAAQRAIVEAIGLTLQANGRGGAAVEAEARLLLEASRITGNGRRGVLVRASGACRLSANMIEHNAGPGVEVVASPGLVLDGNQIRGNRGAGLMLGEGSRAEARSNACEDNSEDGIAVYKGARVRLVGNGAHRNGRFGVWVGSGGEAALDANTAGDNRGGAFMAAHTAVLDGEGVVTAFRRRSDRSARPTPEQARYGSFRGRR